MKCRLQWSSDHGASSIPSGSGEKPAGPRRLTLALRNNEIVSLIGDRDLRQSFPAAHHPSSCRPARQACRSAGRGTGQWPPPRGLHGFRPLRSFLADRVRKSKIGLEALRIDDAERHKRAWPHDLIGLDGYESGSRRSWVEAACARGWGAATRVGPSRCC